MVCADTGTTSTRWNTHIVIRLLGAPILAPTADLTRDACRTSILEGSLSPPRLHDLVQERGINPPFNKLNGTLVYRQQFVRHEFSRFDPTRQIGRPPTRV